LILQLCDAIELLKTESLTGSNSKEGKHKRKVIKEVISFKFPNSSFPLYPMAFSFGFPVFVCHAFA
jgi:hypothetical protein